MAAPNLPAPENRVFWLPGDEPQQPFMAPQYETQSKARLKEILASGSVKNPTIIPGGAERVREALNTAYQEAFNVFKARQGANQEYPERVSDYVDAQLQAYGAIIAGGFMLNALGLFPQEQNKTDTDIYVNSRNLKELNEKLPPALLGTDPNIGLEERKFVKSTTYCLSFLRRNGIRSVQTFKYSFRQQRRTTERSIDVMAVRNHRSPIQVAQNFDLTFAQVWYDGANVYATHPEHVANKVGYLQKSYVPLYLAGNEFLKGRMIKYTRRGFQVFLDPAATEDLETMRIPGYLHQQLTQRQTTSGGRCAIILPRTPLFYKDIAIRIMLEYILTGDYISRIKRFHETKNLTEGYDSDDYGALQDLTPLWDNRLEQPKLTFDKLFDLAKEKCGPAFAEKEARSAFYSKAAELFQLFFDNSIKIEEGEDGDEGIAVSPILRELTGRYLTRKVHLNTLLDKDLYENEGMGRFLTQLRSALFENGDDMFGNEGPLYTFHAHDYPDQGITTESLEAYLMGKKQIADKNAIPCYAAPYCTQNLTLRDIRPFVSNEFYLNFIKEKVVIPNLRNTAFNIAPMILQNTQSQDPLGFGNIYHYTICPFCLVLEERNEGCAYMVHANTKRLPNSEAPWCDPALVVKEIRDKYVTARDTPNLMPDYPPDWRKLEFCVECGRPAVSHKHFNLATPLGIQPHRLDPDNVGNRTYGVCDGGGRAELFARMLAMRKVIMENSGTDKKEVRRLAALAADAAPLNEELMQKGREMLAAEVAERKWTNQEQVNAFVAANPIAENAEEEENNNNNVQSIASAATENDLADLPPLEQENAAPPAAHLQQQQAINPFAFIPIIIEELVAQPLPADQANLLRPDVAQAALNFYNQQLAEQDQEDALRAARLYARIATRAGIRAYLAGRNDQQVAQIIRQVGQLAEILFMGAHEENVFEQAQNLLAELAPEQQGGKKRVFSKTHKHRKNSKKQTHKRR
jgi:hypothetical protein